MLDESPAVTSTEDGGQKLEQPPATSLLTPRSFLPPSLPPPPPSPPPLPPPHGTWTYLAHHANAIFNPNLLNLEEPS